MADITGRKVRYHFRVGLSCDNMEAEEKVMWRIIREAKMDEVMFFVPHVESRSPGLGTVEECKEAARRLEPVFDRLREQGIVPSINVWWTTSFSHFPGRPRSHRGKYDFRWAVNLDGQPSLTVACPWDEAWLKEVKRVYTTFARLKPEQIWIDDDTRATLRADLQCPCFCAHCMSEMEKRTGRTFSSPRDLADAILADPPNPVRNAWLPFQGEMMKNVVREIAEAVHAVSPETRVSLMLSPLEIHSAEGRRWKEHFEALGMPAPYARPPLGCYLEATAFDIAAGFNYIRLAQAHFPDTVTLAPEIENYPGSRFAKSTRLVHAQMVLCQLLGISEITFSMYRFDGRLDLEQDTAWEKMLGRTKPYLQAIADLEIHSSQFRGPAFYFNEDVCRYTRDVADAEKPVFLYRERPWDSVLPLLGFATHHDTSASDIVVLTAEQPCCCSDAELEVMFTKGVLLDARAAESLVLMGKGHLAGLVRRIDDSMGVIEVISDGEFGVLGDPICTRYEGPAWQFEWLETARTVSSLCGYAGDNEGHGVVLYENVLGGRIAVYPYDSQYKGGVLSASFLCWARQAQMVAVLDWLNRGPVPLFVPDAPSVFSLLIDQGSEIIAAVINLSPDPIEGLKLRLAAPAFPIQEIRSLQTAGQWQTLADAHICSSADKGTVTIDTSLFLNYLDTVLVRLKAMGGRSFTAM